MASRLGPACDRVRGRRRLGDALAVPAGKLLAHVLDNLPAARLAFKRPGHDLAEFAQPHATAFTAGTGRWLDNAFDRQIVRQLARPAWRASALFLRRRGRRDLGLGLFLGLGLLEIGNGKFELLNELLAAFRGLPELLSSRLGEHQFQPLDLKRPDLRLAPGLGQHCALREDHRVGGGKVLGKRIRWRRHDPIQPYSRTKIASDPRSESKNHSFIRPPADALMNPLIFKRTLFWHFWATRQ